MTKDRKKEKDMKWKISQDFQKTKRINKGEKNWKSKEINLRELTILPSSKTLEIFLEWKI